MWSATAAIAVLAVGAVLFQPWLLLIDVRVADAIPTAIATAPPTNQASRQTSAATPPGSVESVEMPAPAPGPVDLLAGEFVSHEHETNGGARIIQLPDGRRHLAIEGLVTSNGPDVHVWLSAGPVVEGLDGWFTAAGYDHIDLGPIKGNLGDQLYDIPAEVDLAAFRTVDLWCERFSVSFGAAALS
ncbi:DM13 domain-containing protein [Microbacterium rhizomatis]|uniref:DM13 domain-containing protein n=1 Tax=Microbacterium rhizomatis TaxID=1631477 RepID=A0A5J5J1Q3_9MICO|nr:DM13 domain-containing protein [Microbacterium rhizomatis]